jgi:hypothetical protein
MQFSFFFIYNLIILTILTLSLALLISITHFYYWNCFRKIPGWKVFDFSCWHLNNSGLSPRAQKEVQCLRKEGRRRLYLGEMCVQGDNMYLQFIICENKVHGKMSIY